MTTRQRGRRGDGSYRRRGRNSWELKFDGGTDPKTGKRVTYYESFKGTERDARAKLRELTAQVDKAIYIDPAKMLLADYLDQWLDDYARAAVSAKTFERWRELFDLHVKPHIGTMQLSRLQGQPIAIQGLYTTLLKEGRRDGAGGLSPRTVLHVHAVLSQALKQAVGWRMLQTNPAENVKPPVPQDAEIETLSPEELGSLLQKAEGTKMYAPVLAAATTGMRRGELLALRWTDIDLDKAELRVEQSLEETKAGLRIKPPKTKRSRRTITLPALTVAALRRHRTRQSEERLALGLSGANDWLVFCRYDGEMIRPRNFSKEFARLVKRSGIKHVGLHALRHTHITQLLKSGEHIKLVSERAGHASIAITLQIYSHVIPGMQEDVAKRLDASLRLVLENPS